MSFGDYRDTLHPASFRGVPFVVNSDESEGGRKTIRHEYVNSDFPYIEDLGKAAKEFSVEAMVVGNDFLTQEKRLTDACEVEGQGELVHPYYGRLVVTVDGKPRVRHSKEDGACSYITIHFVRTDRTPFQFPPSDAITGVLSAAGAALEDINSGFQAVFSVTNKAAYYVATASAKVNAAITAIRGIKAQARKLAEFNAKIGQLVTDANILMLSPGDLALSLQDAMTFNFGGGSASNPYNLKAKLSDFYEIVGLFTFGDDDISPDDNLATVNNLVQTSAAIVAARIIVDINFVSADDALRVRDIALDKLDSIMAATEDDALFASLISLKAILVQNVEARAVDLPRIQTYAPAQAVSSLVLSHTLYGDLSGEQDIIDRNRVRNPAFISGPLEVLSA
jgi:prophage DNA circulation protein